MTVGPTIPVKTVSIGPSTRRLAPAPWLAVAMVGLAVMIGWGGPASAQDATIKPVLDRLDRLENELTDLQKQVFRGGGVPDTSSVSVPADANTPKAFAARIEVRVQALERSIRQLTGQVERFDFDLRAAGRRIDELVADVDRRLRDLEQRLGAPVVVGGAGSLPAPATSETGPAGIQGAIAAAPSQATDTVTAPVVVGAAPTPKALQVDPATQSAPTAPAAKPRSLGQLTGTDIKQLDAARADGGTTIGATAGTVTAGAVQTLPAPAATAPAASAPAAPTASVPAATTAPTTAPAATAATTSPAATVPQIASVPQASSQQLYRSAFSLLTKQDFEGAEEAFRSFIDRHGEDPLAGNAVYWLGETYYARRQFADAAVTFADGYQNYPGSTKTPDNLLKLGMSLARLDRAEDACFALARLLEEFPNADTRLVSRAKDERGKLGCSG